MSNVMSLKQLHNKPNRSAFDLSFRRCFTAKVGELLPVMCKEVLPGDNFKLGINTFTRTMPVNSAAYTRIKEYYDYFFVPYRLLWRYFDQFITQTGVSNAQFASSPLTSIPVTSSRSPYFDAHEVGSYLNNLHNHKPNYNDFGFNRAWLSCKLLRYLGYGAFIPVYNQNKASISGFRYDNPNGASGSSHTFLNAFPLLAYQKICQDYFRNTQWEDSNPSSYNVDYLSGNSTKIPVNSLSSGQSAFGKNMFDLNYCTWNKDLFTGLLPSPQYGDTAVISNGALPSTLNFSSLDGSGSTSFINFNSSNASLSGSQLNASEGSMTLSAPDSEEPGFSLEHGSIKLSSSEISGFTVLALRQAEALQKWREISLSGQQDYKSQIEKHFGVNVPNVRSNMCEWIGGHVGVLDIGEVVNTNLQGINSSGSSVQADIAGRGVGNVSGRDSFTASEHGVLMCLYHAVPLMDYTDSMTDLYMLKGSVYDYAIPEFDSVGMQSVPGIALNPNFAANGSPVNDSDKDSVLLSSDYYNSLGYAPRYVDYKTSVDVVNGAFTDTLKFWAAPMSSDYFESMKSQTTGVNGKLTSSFFKCNPALLDNIFAVNADSSWNTDNLLVSCFHDIKAVRNLDYNGLPY